jgi:tRNA threonylcarbamoyl adenosine modification protein (Sua5/YciO/YrdC/YwlC family)
MKRLEIHQENPQQRNITQAVEALKNGELIIYPTDTNYGIGCSIFQKKAIEKLFKLKGKSKFDHVSMVCASIQQAADFVKISNQAFRLFKTCFPGPYTIILPAKNNIPKLLLSRHKEIGVRIPDSPVSLALVSELGHPILNTTYEIDSLMTPEEIYYSFDENNPLTQAVAVILDAGPMRTIGQTTVIRFVDDQLELLREGVGPVDHL